MTVASWSGIRNDVTDAGGDGLGDALGISFLVEGELRRRSGLTELTANGGIALGHFRTALNGAWLIVFKSNGDVTSVTI